MDQQPTIETERLILRPFRPGDAREVRQLAGDPDVARTTLNIPYPYEPGMAESWIATHTANWASGTVMVCALVRKLDARLVGAAGLTIQRDHDRAEMGYWVGKPYWNNGYATEAAAALVHYAFRGLGLHRVLARHFGGNLASGRVMQKVGMRSEGVLRHHVRRWGEYHDIVVYGVLAGETE